MASIVQFDAILAGVLAGLAVLPLLARRRMPLGIGALAALAVAAVAFAAVSVISPYRDWVPETEVAARPNRRPVEGFVTSATCQACHPREHATWDASYHQSMTALATPDAVAGRFPAEITHNGETYRLVRRGDEFWIDIPDPTWRGTSAAPRLERRIVMVTGSHHEQIFWYAEGEDGDRKLVIMPLAYRIEDRRWVPRDAVFLFPPDQGQIHDVGQWNKTCIKCHVTAGSPGLDMDTLDQDGRMLLDSHAAEFGIACEACHGPAEPHVDANRSPRRRYAQRFGEEPDDTIINPARLGHRRASQVCGQCHGLTMTRDEQTLREWWQQGYRFRPGDEFEDADRFFIRLREDEDNRGIQELLRRMPHFWEDTFWSDGMVRVNGREYNGMLDTPCFQRGEMSCLSCHQLHQAADDLRPAVEWADDQLKPGMRGNEACFQCHEDYRADLEAHTYHEPDSTGSNCYNCHMPNTAYGLLKATRSHMLTSPSVQVSLDTGRPNACNQCHLDQTLAWTAEHLQSWYGIPQPELDDDQRTIAQSVLLALRGDAGQRALMAWSMGWDAALEASGEVWQTPYLAQLMLDPYDAVRYIAHRSITAHPGFEDLEFDYVGPAPQRVVAVRSARELWLRAVRMGVLERTGEEILIGPDGTLDQQKIRTLLEQRDNRRVNFQE